MTQPDAIRHDETPVFLDYGDLEKLIRVTRRTIQRMVAAKKFPQPVYLTERNPVFLEHEVHSWMRARVEERESV